MQYRRSVRARPYAMPARTSTRTPYGASRRLRRFGSKSLGGALSRIHNFKRVGEPLYIGNDNAAGFVVAGNTDLVAGGTQINSGFSYLNGTRQVRGALRFALGQAANVSEITNLFDNYRIKKIRLMISFTMNSAPGEVSAAGVIPTSVNGMPIMHHCYDPDDATAPASLGSVLENGYCKTQRLDRVFYVNIVPRAQQSVVGGGAAGGGLLPTGSWLDSSSPAIYHYGWKFGMDGWPVLPVSANNTLAVVITPTYYIEAKNVV